MGSEAGTRPSECQDPASGAQYQGSPLSLWHRSQNSSSPQWRQPGSRSSWKPTWTMRFQCYLWDPQALANQPSPTTSFFTFPKLPTCPTSSISRPGPQPIRPRTSSCPSWIGGGRASLGLPSGGRQWYLWVRHQPGSGHNQILPLQATASQNLPL